MIALLSSLNEGDDEQFYAIALQVAATEAREGEESKLRMNSALKVYAARNRKEAEPLNEAGETWSDRRSDNSAKRRAAKALDY